MEALKSVLRGVLCSIAVIILFVAYQACAQDTTYSYPDAPSTTYEQYQATPEAPKQDRGRWETTVCLDSENSHICVPARVLTGTCETVDGAISDCPVNAHEPVPSHWRVVSKKLTWAPPEHPRTHEELTGKSAKFYTYRTSFKDPALVTNRQLFTRPSFIIPQAGMVVSMVFACRNKRSGEDWGSEVPAVAGVFVMDYLQARFISGLHAMGAGLYATQHYVRAARR